MWKARIMLGLLLFCPSLFSAEIKKLEKDAFSIKLEDRKDHKIVILQLGSMRIKTASRAGFFTISTSGKEPYSFRTYHYKDENGKRIIPELNAYSIMEVTDKENLKSVEINSSLFKKKGFVQQLRLTLAIKRDFPGVLVKSAVINLSNEKNDCHFSWFMPMSSSEYITAEGKHNPPKMYKKIEFKDWIYLPGTGKKLGYAVFMDNSLPGIKFFTNQQKCGTTASWGIMRHGLWVNKKEGNRIDFIVFPANNAEEIKKEYEKVKKDKIFPEFKFKNEE